MYTSLKVSCPSLVYFPCTPFLSFPCSRLHIGGLILVGSFLDSCISWFLVNFSQWETLPGSWSIVDWMFVSPPNSYIKTLILNVMVFRDVPLEGNQVVRVGPKWMEFVPLKKDRRQMSSLCTTWGHSKKKSVYEPGNEMGWHYDLGCTNLKNPKKFKPPHLQYFHYSSLYWHRGREEVSSQGVFPSLFLPVWYLQLCSHCVSSSCQTVRQTHCAFNLLGVIWPMDFVNVASSLWSSRQGVLIASISY